MQFWTRDNPVWNVLLSIGALGTVSLAPFTAADLGMAPVALTWLRIILGILAGLGGKFGNSHLRGEGDPPKDR